MFPEIKIDSTKPQLKKQTKNIFSTTKTNLDRSYRSHPCFWYCKQLEMQILVNHDARNPVFGIETIIYTAHLLRYKVHRQPWTFGRILCSQPTFQTASNKYADQTEWMRRLICAFAARIQQKQIIMVRRTWTRGFSLYIFSVYVSLNYSDRNLESKFTRNL